ncbi:MAG: type IV secretory system conjugative DNA transfer family protein [Nitrospira sp.]|nr:type IV secretory system conjugative DNA transfer family protein [Nitrospira sp.]
MNHRELPPNMVPLLGQERGLLLGKIVMLGLLGVPWTFIPEYWMLWAGLTAMVGWSVLVSLKRCRVAKAYRRQDEQRAYEAQNKIFGKVTRLGHITDAFVQNLRGRSGVLIGALGKELLFYNPWAPKAGNLAVFGPAGTGKSSTMILGTLLNVWNMLGKGALRFSIWVYDPKGELYFVSAAFRKWCGQRIFLIDPFGVTGKKTFYNPLDCVARAVIFMTGELRNWCAFIANCLIPEPEGNKGKTDNSFFREAAKLFLQRLMVYLAVFETLNCHPVRLRELVSCSESNLVMIGNKMRTYEHQLTNRPDTSAKDKEKFRNLEILVQGYGERLLDEMNARNFPSTRQEAEQALDIYDGSTDFGKSTMHSDFPLEEILDEKSTAYVVMPGSKSGTHGQFSSWVSAQMIETIARQEKPSKILLLLDEMGNMPRLPDDTIKKNFALLRSLQARTATFWQSPSQPKIYGDDIAKLIMDQSSLLAAWSIRDPDMAKEFERRSGQTTVKKRSYAKDPKAMEHSWSYSSQEALEPVLSETEILQLPDDEMLVAISGQKMLRMRRIPFWKIGLMRRVAQKNPSEPHDGYPPQDTVEWPY